MELVYELRIGNLVSKSLKSGNGRTLIDKIGPQDIVRIYENISHFNYHPITLTEELLLKFGFIEKEKWFYKEKFLLGYLSTSDHLQAEWRFGGVEGGWNLINIKYLHQLQNLYFILTGKELTYSDVI